MKPFTQAQLNEVMKLVCAQYDVTMSWVRRHLASYCEDMLARQGSLLLPDIVPADPKGEDLRNLTK